jgi:hypothetical protein
MRNWLVERTKVRSLIPAAKKKSMSTWTYKQPMLRICSVLFLTILSGCLGAGGSDGTRSSPLTDRAGGLFGKSAPDRVSLDGGAIVVAGPRGFCVDKASSRTRAANPFVLMASCASIGSDSSVPRQNALLVASATRGTGPTQLGYERFFASPEGRASLSQTGDPTTVSVDEVSSKNGVFRLQLTDSSLPQDTSGLAPTAWRGLFELNGSIVSVKVFSLAQSPLSRDAGFGLVDEFIASIRAVSAGSGTQPAARNALFVGSQDILR